MSTYHPETIVNILKQLEPESKRAAWVVSWNAKVSSRERPRRNGPMMDFTFRAGVTDVVFLAQGIGITPFRSMLTHAHAAALPVTTTLLQVDGGEHVYRAVTEPLVTESSRRANEASWASIPYSAPLRVGCMFLT